MKRRIIAGLAGLAFVLGGVTIAGAAPEDVFIPELGISVPADKAGPVRNALPRTSAPESNDRAPVPTGKPDRIPAHLLGEDTPVPISPELLQPTNAWLVSDGATLVAVYAGAAGENPQQGRFVIVRQNLVAGIQTVTQVDAGPGGPVAITDAPSGEAVETSAQQGRLGFRGANGAAGTLDLSSDHGRVLR